jgi:hypothetical protein
MVSYDLHIPFKDFFDGVRLHLLMATRFFSKAGLIHQINSWRSKYFTVLGFFIAFLIVFVVVVLALYMR